MAVRPAYGFPVRRQTPVSAGLSSSFAAILEQRETQKEAGTQISTKDILIANTAKKETIPTVTPVPSPTINPVVVQSPVVVSIPSANLNVVVPASEEVAK